ncbi:MAG: ThiF family adenylyltransferase [Phycisphaerae bacterium]
MSNPDSRYSRQTLYSEIGEKGQQRLLGSRVLLVGCGALGTVLANTLVRSGLGHLLICDRDYIELNNLQRQVLFDEDDIAEGLPKAVAAARKLRRINREVQVQAQVTDVNHTNIERLAAGADLLLDGTDNFETRFLINDLAVKTSRPWVYGAVIGATGLCMAIVPHDTPCLRCVFEEAPPPQSNPTCDTAGVLGPVVNVIAGLQAMEAMKILSGRLDALNRHLITVDLWSSRIKNTSVQSAHEHNRCPCCKQHRFDYLDGRIGSSTTTLCGRNAVQVSAPVDTEIDFGVLAEKLRSVARGEVVENRFMVRCTIGDHNITVFADGRAIVEGTADPDTARTIYAKYIGA